MLLFFTNNVSLSPGCRFAVSLFQRITSLMFTPWRLAMLESESPLRTRYVMLSLLFASRCALLPAPIVKLWPGFSLDPRSLFHCCKSLVGLCCHCAVLLLFEYKRAAPNVGLPCGRPDIPYLSGLPGLNSTSSGL